MYSGANPNIAPFTVVGEPSGPLNASKVASVRSPTVSLPSETDARALHSEELADQGHELTERATFLAGEDPLERLRLLVGSAVVDNDPDLPVPRSQIRGEQVV